MADDIGQVCQMEIEGVKLVLTGSVKVVTWLAQAIKAIFEQSEKIVEGIKEAKLQQQGMKKLKDIWKLSNGSPPQAFNIDNDIYQKVIDAANKSGLRWTKTIDLDNTDGKTPILVPPQDASGFAAIIEKYLSENITESQAKLNNYNKEISEIKEKMLHASFEEKDGLRIRIENLEQARDELVELLDGKKSTLEKGCTMSFQEYLATGEGTEFEKDPEKAAAEYVKGVEIGPAISAKECFQPVREMALVPESSIRFYVPEMGVTVTRKFGTEDNMVFSTYSFKNDKGEVFEFTDKGMTKDEWNSTTLKEMLEKSGIMESTKCRMFDTEDRLRAYEKYFNNVKLKSEVRLTDDGKLVFSSAEVEKEIRSAVEDRLKGMASAKINENRVMIEVPRKDLIMMDGQYAIKIGDEYLKFAEMKPGSHGVDKYQVFLDKDLPVIHVDKDGKEKSFTASDAKDFINDLRKEAVRSFSESFKRG